MTPEMEQVKKGLDEEVVFAQGCTKPIALAHARSVLTSVPGAVPDSLIVKISGSLIKNIKSVSIPKSGMVCDGAKASCAAKLLPPYPPDTMPIIW